jgi:hypothetical protein
MYIFKHMYIHTYICIYIYIYMKAKKEREYAEEQEKQDKLERDKVFNYSSFGCYIDCIVCSFLVLMPFLAGLYGTYGR